MVKVKYLLLIIFLFTLCQAKSQEEKLYNFYHLSIQHGFIIPHRSSLIPLITGHVTAFELSFGKQVSGKKQWHSNYGFPEMGYSFYYSDLSNEQLGKAYALYPYLNLDLYRGHISGKLKCATGLVYLSQRYDKFENRKNVAIGSHFNAALLLDWMNEISLSEKWKFALGIGMIHFSNGAFVIPNLGLNTPSLKACIVRKVTHGLKEEQSHQNQFAFDKSLTFRLNWGLKGKGIERRDKFQAISLNAFTEKRIGRKGSIGLGMDYFLSEYVANRLAENGEKENFFKSGRVGLSGGYTFYLERASFILQIGSYIIDPYKNDGNIYSRYGFVYAINQNLHLNLTLKSHLSKADYLEFGVGYRILTKQK